MDLAVAPPVAEPAKALRGERGRLVATDVEVCRAIRAIRLAHGMTRRRVAAHLGVTLQTLHKWEQGDIRIFPSALVELSGLFGVPIEAFFPGDLALGQPARRKLRRGKLLQIASFVSTVRRIPSEQLQDAMMRVTVLVREGQTLPAPHLPNLRSGH